MADAGRINVVYPYAAYARQDRKAMSGETIAGAEMIREFEHAGADRQATTDMHSDQLQGVATKPFDHITARYEIADWLFNNWVIQYGRENVVLVAPDAGRAKDVAQIAQILGTKLALLDKRRDERTGEIVIEDVLGKVAGRDAMLVDDMIDGGGTTRSGAEACRDRHAKTMGAIAVHGIFSENAPDNLNTDLFDRIIVTNTLPQKENLQRIDNLTVIDLVPLWSNAAKRIHEKRSLSALLKPKHEYY
jgi:ribose-phosphate pyrophosphokinase